MAFESDHHAAYFGGDDCSSNGLEELSTLGRVGSSVWASARNNTIAAMIGGLLAAGFNLSVDGLVEGERELAQQQS